jgi:hypothetical protein
MKYGSRGSENKQSERESINQWRAAKAKAEAIETNVANIKTRRSS